MQRKIHPMNLGQNIHHNSILAYVSVQYTNVRGYLILDKSACSNKISSDGSKKAYKLKTLRKIKCVFVIKKSSQKLINKYSCLTVNKILFASKLCFLKIIGIKIIQL